MSIKRDILFKDTLQISETCTLLDMSRQNLYKLRKDGRINRLIETDKNSQFTKNSVYQEWFQRHVKMLNIQVPLQPMKTLTALPIYDTDTPLDIKLVKPVMNVLFSNYGISQAPIKIPHEYSLRLYHILCDYVLDLIQAFKHDIPKNTQIDTAFYAWIEYLSFEYESDLPIYDYIALLKSSCVHQDDTATMIQQFIKLTDVYNPNMVFDDYIDDFIENYASFREDLILVMVEVAKLLRLDIKIYDDNGDLKERLKAFHALGHTSSELETFINQLLIILYDAK